MGCSSCKNENNFYWKRIDILHHANLVLRYYKGIHFWERIMSILCHIIYTGAGKDHSESDRKISPILKATS